MQENRQKLVLRKSLCKGFAGIYASAVDSVIYVDYVFFIKYLCLVYEQGRIYCISDYKISDDIFPCCG